MDNIFDSIVGCGGLLGSAIGFGLAGGGARIGGAVAAEAAGRIAALGSLCELGRITTLDRGRQAFRYIVIPKRERKVRPFLEAWFRSVDHFRLPSGENTILCRCEELSLKDVRDVVEIGLAEPNQLKSFSRAGICPCQGRFCGLSLQDSIARETGRNVSDVGYFRLRPPIKPLPLDELAELDSEPEANISARSSENDGVEKYC
ncbi:MAG: hypothetical protein CBB68_05905 [Rhodospirillaceae bacterium TMED8]|nr:hypothetical protein [Magnetovibrio sp.]OUT51161.1 MAG: hypothetical protein CBB68_05905 [Rhodospirillaceae bacterium TMED8]